MCTMMLEFGCSNSLYSQVLDVVMLTYMVFVQFNHSIKVSYGGTSPQALESTINSKDKAWDPLKCMREGKHLRVGVVDMLTLLWVLANAKTEDTIRPLENATMTHPHLMSLIKKELRDKQSPLDFVSTHRETDALVAWASAHGVDEALLHRIIEVCMIPNDTRG
jgi:hypothetical protein